MAANTRDAESILWGKVSAVSDRPNDNGKHRVTILTGVDGGQNVRLLPDDMDRLGIKVGGPVAMVVRFGLFTPVNERTGQAADPMLIAVYVRPVSGADLDLIGESIVEPAAAR